MAEPASPPPTPAFLAEYIGYQVIGVAVAFAIIEISLVALRFVARRINKSSPGWDDYLIIPGLIANLAQCALAITMIKIAGVGHHVAEVVMTDPNQLVLWAKCLIAMEWIYGLAVMLPKLAILGFYLRIFVNETFRMTVYVLIGVVIATFLTTGIAAVFQCIPLQFVWDKTILGGHCFDVLAFYRWVSFPNILTDLCMLVLPIPTIWKLNTSHAKKVGLTFGFLMGSTGFISSIVRFAIFFRVNAFGDPTWASVLLIIWTTVEPGMYLIAACIPSLRPLLLQVFPSTTTRHATGAVSGENKSGMKSGGGRYAMKAFSKVDSGSLASTSSKEGFSRLGADGDLESGSFQEVPNGKIGVRSDFHVETNSAFPHT